MTNPFQTVFASSLYFLLTPAKRELSAFFQINPKSDVLQFYVNHTPHIPLSFTYPVSRRTVRAFLKIFLHAGFHEVIAHFFDRTIDCRTR